MVEDVALNAFLATPAGEVHVLSMYDDLLYHGSILSKTTESAKAAIEQHLRGVMEDILAEGKV